MKINHLVRFHTKSRDLVELLSHLS